jgi:hypothetical protein
VGRGFSRDIPACPMLALAPEGRPPAAHPPKSFLNKNPGANTSLRDQSNFCCA